MTEPGQVDADEQRQRHEHERNRERLQPPVPDLHRQEQRGKPDQRTRRLALEEPERVAEPGSGVHGARAVHHHHAEHDEEQHRAEERRVVAQDGPELLGPLLRHAGSGDGGERHESPRTSALNWSPLSSKLRN